MLLVEILDNLLRVSLVSIVMIVLILLIRMLLAKKVKMKHIYSLWFILMIRLVFPFEFESQFSVEQIIEKPITYLNEQREREIPVFDNPAIEYSEVKKEVYTDKTDYEKTLYVLGYIWLFGMFVVVFTPTISYFTLKHMLNQQREVDDTTITRMIQRNKRILGIRKSVVVKFNPYIDGPALIGVFQPIIVLPYELASLSEEKLESIIVHELAHLRLHHLLFQWLFWLIKAVYWFNPMIWLAHELMKQDAELMCDELTLEVIGAHERQTYGHLLVDLSEMSSNNSYAMNASGLINKRSELFKRIKRIKRELPNKKVYKYIVMAITLVVVVMCFTTLKTENILATPAGTISVDLSNTKEEFENISFELTHYVFDAEKKELIVDISYEVNGSIIDSIEDAQLKSIAFELDFPKSYAPGVREEIFHANVNDIQKNQGQFQIVFDHVFYEPERYNDARISIAYLDVWLELNESMTFQLKDMPEVFTVGDWLTYALIRGSYENNRYEADYRIDISDDLEAYDLSCDIDHTLVSKEGYKKSSNGLSSSNSRDNYDVSIHYKVPLEAEDEMTYFIKGINFNVLYENNQLNRTIDWYLGLDQEFADESDE